MIEVGVAWSVFKLEKKTKKNRETEEKLLMKKNLPCFVKAVEFLNTLILSCRKFMRGALNTDILHIKKKLKIKTQESQGCSITS